ncbi:MAG: hypothetical protein AB7G11_08975 [Phycisphaerales bacterium]
MSKPFIIAVSPYHLATREAPAMCALLLADRVITLMPAPESGSDRANFDLALRRSPRFFRYMDRIRWSIPLWNAGVIQSGMGDEDLGAGLRDTCRQATDEAGMWRLRAAFDVSSQDSEHGFLDRVCSDLLKGGPDPSISIPIAARVDEFAHKHDVPVARSAPVSVVQRAESMLQRRRGVFSMPIVTQVSGARLLELRDRLSGPLGALRGALRSVVGGADADSGSMREVGCASRDLAAEFERARAGVLSGDDETGTRIMTSYASVSIVDVPIDVVFRASAQALRGRAREKHVAASASRRGGPRSPVSESAGEVCSAASGTVVGLVVKELRLSPSG